MSIISNVFRYPAAVVLMDGIKSDSKVLDRSYKEFHAEVSSPESIDKMVIDLKRGLPVSLEFIAKPLAKTIVLVGKRSLVELGGAFSAAVGGLGFLYGSSPGAWVRDKFQSTSNYIYEKIKPIFHWGGAALGAVGVCSIGAGLLLKKSPDTTTQKVNEE